MATNASARSEQNEQISANDLQSAPRNDKSRFGACGASSVLNFLYNRVRDLDKEELGFLSSATEAASHMANNLADVVSGVGCLVSWDDQPDKLQAGNFRSGSDVSTLLFTISEQIAVIGALGEVGSEASFKLLCMERGHV